jgi:hypothetical protein
MMGGHDYSSKAAVDAVSDLPELQGILVATAGAPPAMKIHLDTGDTEEVLNLKYRPLKETFYDLAYRLLALEKQFKSKEARAT